MKLQKLLEKACRRLEKETKAYALCGGLAANLYRPEPRFTGDIDFVISTGGGELSFAKSFIKDFGLSPRPIRLGELSRSPMMGKKSTPYVVVIGRDPEDDTKPGLDFLLPANKWVPKALKRASEHRISYGFAEVPVLSVEDVLLAKIFAVKDSRRAKDVDDVESIFAGSEELDLKYLCAELDRHRLSLPRDLEKNAPKAIAVASKRIRLAN